MRADMGRAGEGRARWKEQEMCHAIPTESFHHLQRLLDLCFPPWLHWQDEGIFIANTAKCGPAARSVPGMIN